MSQFDFTLKHVAGSKMGKADGLSRRVDWKVVLWQPLDTKFNDNTNK